MLNGIAVSFLSWALNGPLKFTETGAGTNVDLRSDRFAETALVGDIGHLFGFRTSAHLSWLFPLAVVAAVTGLVPDQADAPRLRGSRGRVVTGLGEGRRHRRSVPSR